MTRRQTPTHRGRLNCPECLKEQKKKRKKRKERKKDLEPRVFGLVYIRFMSVFFESPCLLCRIHEGAPIRSRTERSKAMIFQTSFYN